MSEYYLNVITKHDDGYGSRWYGWSRNLTFKSHKEALDKKKSIEHLFFEVEIVELIHK